MIRIVSNYPNAAISAMVLSAYIWGPTQANMLTVVPSQLYPTLGSSIQDCGHRVDSMTGILGVWYQNVGVVVAAIYNHRSPGAVPGRRVEEGGQLVLSDAVSSAFYIVQVPTEFLREWGQSRNLNHTRKCCCRKLRKNAPRTLSL